MRRILFIALISVCIVFSVMSNTALAASPTYLWHTFYGSEDTERAYGIVVDSSDCSFIVGRSRGNWTGPSGEAPKHDHSNPGSNPDLFVLKLDHDGQYLWHTFFGQASGADYAMAAALDGGDNIYVTGFSWGSWKGPLGEDPKHPYGDGDSKALVLKLDSNGGYQWHTFFGNGTEDEGQGIAVDASGNAYVAMKSDYTWNGPSGELPKNDYAGSNRHIAVFKLNSAGAYQWHTFFGSDTGEVDPASIAVDGNAVYVTGTSAAGWDVGVTPPKNSYSGADDMVVLKLSNNGDYQWHTFYGSSLKDGGNGITASAGSIYVTGYSFATWDGPGSRSPRHAYSGQADITALKLNSEGAYQWHTFYGSTTSDDYGLELALDSGAGVCIVGRSKGTWMAGGSSPVHPYTGDADLTVLRINSTGDYQWHTFYGSSSQDLGQDITIDSRGYIHATGASLATWAGDGDTPPLHGYTGDQDVYELVLGGVPEPVPTVGEWGLIALGVGFLIAIVWMIRRRVSMA
jgi:hypothetical protein